MSNALSIIFNQSISECHQAKLLYLSLNPLCSQLSTSLQVNNMSSLAKFQYVYRLIVTLFILLLLALLGIDSKFTKSHNSLNIRQDYCKCNLILNIAVQGIITMSVFNNNPQLNWKPFVQISIISIAVCFNIITKFAYQYLKIISSL